MRTLHTYLLRQVVLTLVMTVFVFTLILLLGNGLKEIAALLVSGRIGVGMIGHTIALLIPWVTAYALPFAMLAATLLTFGRFSADNELTAVRASGISLVALVTPILILSVLLTGLCVWFNLKVAPECRVAYKELILKLGVQNTSALISEDRFIDEIPGIVLYVRKLDGDDLKDVRLYTVKKNVIEQRISASEGRVVWENDHRSVRFELRDAVTEIRNPSQIKSTNAPTETATNSVDPAPPLAEPSGEQEVEWMQVPSRAVSFPPIDLEKASKSKHSPRLSEMTHQQLRAEIAQRREQGISVTPARFHLHRQVAFSFATVGFAMIGIPLGIRTHRRETSIGMVISLGLVMLYYCFFFFAEFMQTHTALRPWLIVWAPNFLFQGVGAILLWQANRRG